GWSPTVDDVARINVGARRQTRPSGELSREHDVAQHLGGAERTGHAKPTVGVVHELLRIEQRRDRVRVGRVGGSPKTTSRRGVRLTTGATEIGGELDGPVVVRDETELQRLEDQPLDAVVELAPTPRRVAIQQAL